MARREAVSAGFQVCGCVPAGAYALDWLGDGADECTAVSEVELSRALPDAGDFYSCKLVFSFRGW
jgi:hypothetical protein